MKFLYRIYSAVGRLSYPLLLPLMRLLIRRTRRAYVIIEHDGRVLVIKNWLSRRRWHLPGGGVGHGESPAEAAIRETAEELGIVLNPELLKLIARSRWQTDGLGHTYYIFKASIKQLPKLKIQRHEIVAAKWLPPGDLTVNVTSRELVKAISEAGLK